MDFEIRATRVTLPLRNNSTSDASPGRIRVQSAFLPSILSLNNVKIPKVVAGGLITVAADCKILIHRALVNIDRIDNL